MDVFGTVVSAIDFAEKLISYVKAVKDAEQDRLELISEVSALKSFLEIMRHRLGSTSTNDNGGGDDTSNKVVKAGIQGPLNACYNALKSTMDKLENLVPKDTRKRPLAAEWMRNVKWPFKQGEIKTLLSNIERLKTLLSLALQTSLMDFIEKTRDELAAAGQDIKAAVLSIEANQRAHMKKIEAVQNIVERSQQGQECRDVLNWLSAPDFDQKRAIALGKHAAGTGGWFLNHSAFQAWRRGDQNVLWCPGNPGVGKSVMTSVIIRHLQEGLADDTTVVFIYFDYTARYTTQQLVEALLSQFIRQGMSIPNMRSLQKHIGNRPTLDELWAILGTEMGTYARVFVVIDALDEAHDEAWILLLERLRELSGISILATSRDLGDIAVEFREDCRLDIMANEGDLKKYIEERLSKSVGRFKRLLDANQHLREEIPAGVVEKADGMFLLAQLHVDALRTKASVADLRRALGRLPGDLKSAYDATMSRISNEDKPLALRIFSWVIHAVQPLTIDDLQYALAVDLGEDGMTSIDPDRLYDPDHLMSVCVGLVIRHEQFYLQSYRGYKKIYVELVHYTTQDYLRKYVSDTQLPHPVDPAHLAITCLKYLAFDAFNGPFNWHSGRGLKNTPLAEYAIEHWGGHVREHYDVPTVRQLAMGLFNQKAAVLGFLTFHTQGVSAIQLCAYFGLEDYLIRLLDDGSDVNSKDSDGNTALTIATKHGHRGILELLLKQEGVDVNAKNSYGGTVLIEAAARGREGIVQFLLEQGADVNARDLYGNTALIGAANRGHEGIMQLLLKQGVDVNTKDFGGDTVLIKAVKYGREGIVGLLLKHEDVDVNVKDSDGYTALIGAAGDGCEGIVQLLLKQEGINVNATSFIGPALAAAARCGHEGIMQLLLKQEGVDVNAKGGQGATPLIQAVMSEHQRIVELLLARDGVNINLQDEGGYTLLAWAIGKEHEAIVRMLLARDDLDISLTDNDRNTHLTLAARHNRDGCIAKLLLNKGGIDVNSRNVKGEVALATAASQGHDAVIKILLAQDDIDINAMDLEGRTPLDQASTQSERGFYSLISPHNLTNTIKLLQAAGARTGVEFKAELKAGGAPV